jgi:hypothetical protein
MVWRHIRKWRYTFIILDFSTEWSAFAPTALPPGIQAKVPTAEEAGWAPELVWIL